MPNDTTLTPAARKMLDDFKSGFLKALVDDRAEIAAGKKVHDPKKREYVDEVDPALADKWAAHMPDDDENDRSNYLLGDETDFVFVDGQDGAPEDEDDDEAPPTADLVARVRALLADAANEEQPLTSERYGALCYEVEALIVPELAALKP
jgi:hypothetical protein